MQSLREFQALPSLFEALDNKQRTEKFSTSMANKYLEKSARPRMLPSTASDFPLTETIMFNLSFS